MPSPIDSDPIIITQNRQFIPLADQGNDGLKMFLNNIPSCHGTSPQAVGLWYICFTQHVLVISILTNVITDRCIIDFEPLKKPILSET